MKPYAVLVVSLLAMCIASSAAPPADMEEGDGFYGFQVHHRISESARRDLVRGGLPRGLERIENVPEYNRIRIKGTDKAVDAVWERLGELDSTAAARIVYHVRLQDVIASDVDLAKAGMHISTHDTTWDDSTRQQIARDIQDAIRKGILKPTGATRLDIEEGHAVSLSTRRATIRRDPAFWEERPVPSFIQMRTRLKPTMDVPSRPAFEVELKTVTLDASGKPFMPEYPEGEDRFGEVVAVPNGEATVLGAIMDEQHTFETGKKGEIKTEGVWRVVLATTTVDNPCEPGVPTRPRRAN